jgi:hypothetical protein
MSREDDPNVARVLSNSAARPMMADRRLDPRTTGLMKEMVYTNINQIEKNANVSEGPSLQAKVCLNLGENRGVIASAMDWVGSLFGSDSPMVSVIAYVPTVHSGIPDPQIEAARRGITMANNDPQWQSLIATLLTDSSAIFTSSTESGVDDLTSLKPGDWVRVEYMDLVNKKNGILLSPNRRLGHLEPGTGNTQGSRASHANGPPIPQTGAPGSTGVPIATVETFIHHETTVTLPPGRRNTENRVRRNVYLSMPWNSSLLVDVPSTGNPRKAHVLVAKRLDAMNRAYLVDAANQNDLPNHPFTVTSGWRRHRWTSYEQYKRAMTRGYGSRAEGGRWKAYASPHETGNALDLGQLGARGPRCPADDEDCSRANGGWTTKRGDVRRLEKLPTFKWLQNNAHKFGFTPYKTEPWHWEVQMPRENWMSGEEFVQNENYNVYVREQSVATGRYTDNLVFGTQVFE